MKSFFAPTIKLVNNVEIPSVGYGTYKEDANQETVNAIANSIKSGYRHIDTASRYGNEWCVAQAIKKSKVKREDLFITTKLWNDNQGYKSTINAFNKSLKELELKYLDLYLIHWPVTKNKEKQWKQMNIQTWKAFEYLYKNKKIKAIGVSNFEIRHLKNLIKNCEIKPMVNQIEMHPGLANKRLLRFCKKHNIAVEAYSPLARGMIQNDKILLSIANSHNKTPAQISVRWCLQKGLIPLPKSTHLDRIKNNIDVFNFSLSSNEIKTIDKKVKIKRILPSPNKGK